jgi:hypothetical protein
LALGRSPALGGEVRFKVRNVRFEQGDLVGLDPRNRYLDWRLCGWAIPFDCHG